MDAEIKKQFEPTLWHIEISSDDDLFKLFSELIKPISRYETLEKRKSRLKDETIKASGTLAEEILSGIFAAIAMTIKLAIPFAIVFLIVTNLVHTKDGTSWYKLYEDMTNNMVIFAWIGKLSSAILAKISKLGFLLNFILGLLMLIIFIILSLCVIPSFMFLFPVLAVIFVIISLFTHKSNQKTIEKNSVTLKDIQEEIDFIVDDLTLPLQFVPPDYCYSEALEYFCRSYANGKASTIKEAMILYDNYLHQQAMEQGQQEISHKQSKILDEIEYQNQRLDSIQSELNDVKSTADSVYWRV